MAFEQLNPREQDIVLRSMKAVDRFIGDHEKHARLGLEPPELRAIIARWPLIDDSDDCKDGFLAINNCLNEVCHGFRIAPDEWSSWFNTPMSEVRTTYRTWLKLKGISGGIL